MSATAGPVVMTGYEETSDDHAFLKRYRQETPVAISPAGFPLALRHHHLALLTDPQTTRQLETEALLRQGITAGPVFELFSKSMLFSNGATHQRRRGPIARTFAFKMMEALRGDARAIAEEIVLAAKGTGPVDYLAAFAGEIPARLIARILGVPDQAMPRFRALVYSVTRAFVIGNMQDRAAVERDIESLIAEIEQLLDDRTARPQDDFLSHYLAEAGEIPELSAEEVRWQVVTLIIAGADTTRLALCAGLSHLLQHEAQWAAFCADPEGLKKQAVQETLRYDPPIASFARITLEDMDLDGVPLPKGTPLSVSTMSAMRDEAVYSEPDRFDIAREDHPRWHPVFGAGAHRCLGEALARVELEESLSAIARLAPGTRLDGTPPVIRGLNGIRRIDRMAVRFS